VITNSAMDRAEAIVRNRVDKLGASEASIQRQGQKSILVQLPGIKNRESALAVLGSTGQLEFVNVNSITDTEAVAAILGGGNKRVKLKPGTYAPVEVDGVKLTGEAITNAGVTTNQQTGEIEVTMDLNSKAARAWASYTAANVGNNVAIVLDGVVQSAPRVNEPITGGRTSITGNFTPEEAKNLKTVLETGALPVTLEFSESRSVGPTLGQDSLKAGVLAVVIGLGLVALYLIGFYRGLGILAVAAMVVFGSIFMGILAVLSALGAYALSLPGIAGIVLTIGVAADSSILILERFREEVGMGKTIRSAAKSGSLHAIWTSVDADLVTFVSAAALAIFAIGPVRGFAITLMIGIGCDIIMMLMFKRPALMLLAENVLGGAPALWGIPKAAVVVEAPAKKKGGAGRA
jgi:preprotein translocase subunit SecD/SecD/SecF fusion protein